MKLRTDFPNTEARLVYLESIIRGLRKQIQWGQALFLKQHYIDGPEWAEWNAMAAVLLEPFKEFR